MALNKMPMKKEMAAIPNDGDQSVEKWQRIIALRTL
jgi:hypothetical protein